MAAENDSVIEVREDNISASSLQVLGSNEGHSNDHLDAGNSPQLTRSAYINSVA